MKELSIEEKAKRYDKALERAKEILEFYKHPAYSEVYAYAKEDIPGIFPELAENEDKDEKIRKNCIHFLELQKSHHAATFEIEECIDWLEKQKEPEDKGEISDGYHTFNELYRYRMLYNAAFFNLLPKEIVHKSKRHHDGEECFGGGWFIVMANLPTGQISNHYELKDWDLFQIPEKEVADEWDGHTPQEAADRLHEYLFKTWNEQIPTFPFEQKHFKQSECEMDEIVRKELIDAINGLWNDDALPMPLSVKRKNAWLAWLEKQKAKEDLDRMAPIYEDKESFKSALEKAWELYNNSGARTVDICEDNYVECAYAEGFREGFLFGLKRHESVLPNVKEEQKPADKVNPKFKVGDVMRTLQEADGNITSGLPVVVFVGNEYYHCINELIAIKDQGDYEYPPMNRMQEPTDKVEPKFKVGDWITDGENTWKIAGIGELDYLLRSQNGDAVNVILSYVDKHFHLWSIQDAKEGNVLARNNDILSICIFSHFNGINNKYSSFLCHCGLEGEGLGQMLSINGYHDDCKDYIPATKEQCNLLFQKIKEAGYEWNNQRKQLDNLLLYKKN